MHKRRGKILAKCLGMYWDKGPCRYLGVQITGNRLKKGDFADLLARIQGMLGSWCRHTLSIAGRAILIQTILQAMPLYLMTNTRVPVAVLEEIESIYGKFLLELDFDDTFVKSFHWSSISQAYTRGLHAQDFPRMMAIDVYYIVY